MALSILVLVFGILLIAKPSIVWLMAKSWRTNENAEPSKIVTWLTRLVGLIFILIGAVGISFLFV